MKHSDTLRAPEILFEDDRQHAADALDAAERYIVKRGHADDCDQSNYSNPIDKGCGCGHDAVLKQIRGEE